MRNRLSGLYIEIGKKIKEFRELRCFTQEYLAQKAGLKRPSIVLIEQGHQKLPIDRLYLIADALSCTIYDLLPQEHTHAKIKTELDEVSKDRIHYNEIHQVKTILGKFKKDDTNS